MPWLKKKSDPISDRARALNSEIAALESQIKRLDAKLHQDQTQPRLRSTAMPHGENAARPATVTATAAPAPSAPPPPAPVVREPIFEDLEQKHLSAHVEPPSAPELYNEHGVRKYDVPALAARVKQIFRGPTTMNPRLVSYLAAGGIQGLQPLRREKRVARNRFIALAAFLFLILLGLIYMFAHSR